MPGPSTFDYFTLGIASVGAVTGLAALGATCFQFLLSGPRLRITASTAIGGDELGRFFLSVGVQNRGRTAATVSTISLQIEGSEAHMPLGMLLAQGNASGPRLPVRLEPYTGESWLVAVEPIVRDLHRDGRSTTVRPFVDFQGKPVRAAKALDLARIAKYNQS